MITRNIDYTVKQIQKRHIRLSIKLCGRQDQKQKLSFEPPLDIEVVRGKSGAIPAADKCP